MICRIYLSIYLSISWLGIRNQSLRAMRYLLNDESSVKLFQSCNMDLFVVRSLERDSGKYLWERMQVCENVANCDMLCHISYHIVLWCQLCVARLFIVSCSCLMCYKCKTTNTII